MEREHEGFIAAGITMGIVTILGIVIYYVGGWLHYYKSAIPRESLGIQEFLQESNTGLHLCRIENINKK